MAAHKSWWQTFEVVFGIPFLAAIALQFYIPLPIYPGSFSAAVIFGGFVLIIVGLVLITFARREFAKYSQPTDPGLPTEKLVTTGVFSISRNPLYLGGICVLLGIGIVFNITWFWVLFPLALGACHYLLIIPEEEYLNIKFGAEYKEYASSVHRWIGLP